MTVLARRFTTHMFWNHADKFWYESQVSRGSDLDHGDVQLQDEYLVGINLGLR